MQIEERFSNNKYAQVPRAVYSYPKVRPPKFVFLSRKKSVLVRRLTDAELSSVMLMESYHVKIYPFCKT